MLAKPDSCKGCPWYQTGDGFVADTIADGKLFVLLPSPGETDEIAGAAGAGYVGQALRDTFIPLADVTPESVSMGHVLRCRWNDDNELPNDANQAQAVAHCTQAHLQVPSHASLVVASGSLPVSVASAGAIKSLYDWRGFILPGEDTAAFTHLPVFAVAHILDLHRDPSLELLSKFDWRRVKAILEGAYPQPVPESLIADQVNIAEVTDWFKQAETASWVVVDTEYVPDTTYLTMLGLLARFPDGSLSPMQIDRTRVDPWGWTYYLKAYAKLVSQVPVVMHNCRADVPILRVACKADWSDYKRIDDTMLAHAILWCELPHDLGFLASVYGRHEKLKHLKDINELRYNLGDILETNAIWETVSGQEFKSDPQAKAVYETQSLALCPIVDKTVQLGLKTNPARVVEVGEEDVTTRDQAEKLALACAGWPFNLNSSAHLAEYLYRTRKLKPMVNKKTKGETTDADAIAALRMQVGPAFDPDIDLTINMAHNRILDGADPILEARTLYAAANTRLIRYIYPMFKSVQVAKTDKAKKAAIECIQFDTVSDIVDRVYPDILIHSQKTGRWSTVNFPTAQLPADLRDVICPDPGYVWLGWDWSAVEPRILEGYCKSKILKQAFDEGIDLHTWTVCSVFGYDMPPNLINVHKAPENAAWREQYKWKGSDDPRRVFAKQVRYEMYYGGSGSNAIASAALFGLKTGMLRAAASRLVTADMEYYKWRVQTEDVIRSIRVLRTFTGRPRRFLTGGNKALREGLDYQMQGGCSDIANLTIIGLAKMFPQLTFAWSMHDSQKWACRREDATPILVHSLIEYASRAHTINGREVKFPIDFGITYAPGEEVIAGLEQYTKH